MTSLLTNTIFFPDPDIRMNTELKVKLTPNDDKTEYHQNLPMPIHLKEDLNVDLVLMLK